MSSIIDQQAALCSWRADFQSALRGIWSSALRKLLPGPVVEKTS